MLCFTNVQALSFGLNITPDFEITAELELYDTNGSLIASATEDAHSLFTDNTITFSDPSLISDFVIHDFTALLNTDNAFAVVSMQLDWGQSHNIPHVDSWSALVVDGFFAEKFGDLIVGYYLGPFSTTGTFLTNIPIVDDSNNLPFLESGMRLNLSLAAEIFVVPVPAAFWLFGSSFAFLGAFRKAKS
jgi:hypothetical protein